MKTAEGKALHEWILFQFSASQGNLELPQLIAKVEAAGRRDGMTEASNICCGLAAVHSAPGTIENYRHAIDLIHAARDAKTSGP